MKRVTLVEESVGNFFEICLIDQPKEKYLRTRETGIRVPAKQGLPPAISLLALMMLVDFIFLGARFFCFVNFDRFWNYC